MSWVHIYKKSIHSSRAEVLDSAVFKILPVDTHQNNSSKDLIDRLRWVTLGYHHNWDTKVYSESMRTEFPPNLSRLSKAVATATGHDKFEAQAAIVNFYHMHSSLSGHTDHSEIHMEEPIISFSFGQSAIFLLGGSTKAVPPVPIILRSGDVAVMAGASRSAYHAVPRILPTDNCHVADLYHDCTAADEAFGKYIASARININVRQVLPPGQKFMSSGDGSATT
ncbi:PREDICTED: DNA oxidative demethylase ALKBH1-like isoform X2 [Priapulus caudatus]|uniref:DNA oxidative demethylase ALKBH1-like isoform X2 n=1 Tax=Priapulus caudatus TaxID=37621 RepID=A0ABM1E679_PRICU|nr:PREDICTED: DNA oxidative demethylase ALKBH1-like isoform X2 [Priapulus caudatus]